MINSIVTFALLIWNGRRQSRSQWTLISLLLAWGLNFLPLCCFYLRSPARSEASLPVMAQVSRFAKAFPDTWMLHCCPLGVLIRIVYFLFVYGPFFFINKPRMIMYRDLCFTVDGCSLAFGRIALNFILLTLHCNSSKQNGTDPNRDESLQQE